MAEIQRKDKMSEVCFISHFHPLCEQSLNGCDALLKPSYREVVAAYCVSDGK